jgi:hypothetical protein
MSHFPKAVVIHWTYSRHLVEMNLIGAIALILRIVGNSAI